MSKSFLLCSNCFQDEGLKINAFKIGVINKLICPNCKRKDGKKLDIHDITQLCNDFFIRGSLVKYDYGASSRIKFGIDMPTNIQVHSKELKNDMSLITKVSGYGFFYYGPRFWMLGDVEPLRDLLSKSTSKKKKVIKRILKEYPIHILKSKDKFYRIRKEPNEPLNHLEYDSPPDHFLGKGRLDSKDSPILYASQDLDICVHECRVTVDDVLYLATLEASRELKLLDLTTILNEENSEFESLDMAIHMLFCAGDHSYKILRFIVKEIKKAGLDGVIYSSFFSITKTGVLPFETYMGISIRKLSSLHHYVKSQIIPNIAIFGRPIQEKKVRISCINKLSLKKVYYDISLGIIC